MFHISTQQAKKGAGKWTSLAVLCLLTDSGAHILVIYSLIQCEIKKTSGSVLEWTESPERRRRDRYLFNLKPVETDVGVQRFDVLFVTIHFQRLFGRWQLTLSVCLINKKKIKNTKSVFPFKRFSKNICSLNELRNIRIFFLGGGGAGRLRLCQSSVTAVNYLQESINTSPWSFYVLSNSLLGWVVPSWGLMEGRAELPACQMKLYLHQMKAVISLQTRHSARTDSLHWT